MQEENIVLYPRAQLKSVKAKAKVNSIKVRSRSTIIEDLNNFYGKDFLEVDEE